MSAYVRAQLLTFGGGGGSSDPYKRAGVVSIANAVATKTVTFSSAVADTTYVPVFCFQNTADSNPIFLAGYISGKTVNGFTVTFNAPTDSANYSINYIVSGAA